MRILKTATPRSWRAAYAINLADLRRLSNGYLHVMSENQASEYHILLELLFDWRRSRCRPLRRKMRLKLMALDEAGNIAPPKLQDKLKIGRFRIRLTCLVSGRSTDHGSFRRMAVRPCWRNEESDFSSRHRYPETSRFLLGPATVLSRTEVDATEPRTTLNASPKVDGTAPSAGTPPHGQVSTRYRYY